jgi:hypothetical protein
MLIGSLNLPTQNSEEPLIFCTSRSGHEFERIAKSSLFASIAGVIVLPFFMLWPFAAMVLRSVAGSLVSSIYQHAVRPLKVGWCLPLGEFFNLVKRGLRLFAGSYLRYQFWMTVEILLMVRVAGDAGVGLFCFQCVNHNSRRTAFNSRESDLHPATCPALWKDGVFVCMP